LPQREVGLFLSQIEGECLNLEAGFKSKILLKGKINLRKKLKLEITRLKLNPSQQKNIILSLTVITLK